MNTDKTPQQETIDSMVALMYAVIALISFTAGAAAMWLLTRIWS